MAPDTSPTSDVRDEPLSPAGTVALHTEAPPAAVQRPFSLAALLDLNDEELAQPLSRAPPAEQRWEQLTLGVATDTGEATATTLRSGAASQPPSGETELIPGLDVPGAVEVPVYLAGRTLRALMHSTPTTRPFAAPLRPPAIAVTAVGRPRTKLEAPAANFSKTQSAAVLWPKRKKAVVASAVPQECAKCGSAFDGDHCTTCGHDVSVSSRARRAGVWNDIVAAFLESDSRVIRTLGALVLAPGELTRAFVGGRHRRYVGPALVAIATLVVFAVISGVGGLRPRPDRVLTIGTDRTLELLTGLADQAPVNLAVDAPPDLVRDVASALDYLPLLWLPLMAFGVIAVVAGVRTFDRREDYAEMAFTAHFAGWFVLWWGLIVPVMLLVTNFGLEYGASVAGVTRVRYLENGRIDGLSASWNATRSLTASPGFHTALLAAGLLPWTIVAYRRAFDTTWVRALIAAGLVVAVPLLLLLPFA